jgi:ligand-binding sensor domain-containing protein
VSIDQFLKGLVGRWRLAATAAFLLLGAVTGRLFWETSRTVQEARTRTQSESSVGLSIRPLDGPIPPNIDAIGAPSAFRDAAVFHGHMFVAGPQGLAEYDASAALVRRFRPGFELPPVTIVSLAVGVLAARSEPELLISTAGEGLLVLNGQRLVQVRPEQADHRKITATLVLAGGRILFGTDKAGVFAYDGRQAAPAHPSLRNVPVTALAGADGDVWIGTVDRGVLHWRAGAVERIDESSGLPDARVLSLAVSDNRAYVGTALGVAEFRDGKYARTLGSGLFAQSLAVRHDTLLVGTLDDMLAEIPLAARSSRGVRPVAREAPTAVQRFIDGDGTLYAVADEAVYAVDDRTWGLRRVIGADRAQLSDRNVSALAIDKTGRLWVGYFDRGLDILDPSGARVSHVENDRVFCVNRIVHDAAGGVTAVGTANGLVLFDSAGRQRQVLGRAEGLIADHVTDVVLSADHMTVATPAGLTFIDPDGSRSLYAFHGLVNNHVYAIGASGTQVLAGTLGGASMLDHGLIRTSYTTANSSLTHNWITAVARVDDEWFVGTYGGGLFRLDARGIWQRFAEQAGPIEINPNAMVVTESHVFAGTLSKGLLAYDRQTRRWTTFLAGLPSLNVTALAAAAGVLYVGTDNGIVRMSEQAVFHQ